MGNVLNALPKSQQGRAKADLQAIWMAATRADAYAAFDRFVTVYAAKYPTATETLKEDRESLLAFYDFPAEHWQHLRTTNAIESTFATVRHRTTRTRNCVSRPTFLGLAFKLIEEAEKTWRRIDGPNRSSCCWRALPSGTANRCKAINRFSRNSPPEVERYQAAHTPLLTIAPRHDVRQQQGDILSDREIVAVALFRAYDHLMLDVGKLFDTHGEFLFERFGNAAH
jgi:hypothetical protein